ncbi:MAG: FIST C-terminal domain-containing protein, partial [Candidatus Omnitrophota bacterium]
VETIDGQPACALYEEYLNCGLPQLTKDLDFISVFYPLGLRVEDEEEYLLRSVVAIEPNGNLRFKGTVPRGQTVRLMIGTKETCLESAREAAKEAKQSLLGLSSDQVANLKKEPLSRFALIISSFARQKLLGSASGEELKIIKEELGDDIPMVGLTSSGELAPLKGVSYKGQAYLRNQTISILIVEG